MPFYTRDDIRPGVFLTLDAPVDVPIRLSTPRPQPVRYGDPDPQPFSEVSARLDEARARLEKLRTDLRAARERK